MTSAGRFLVLDDDESVGTMISTIADRIGFETRAVKDPDLFFAEVAQWRPTHIAIDLVLQDSDGVQVIAQLGQIGCKASVVIISGIGGRVLDAAARSAHEHGLRVIGTLPKPFTPAALRNLIGERDVSRAAGRIARSNVVARDADAEKAQRTASELRRGLARGEFFVVYQPKVSCLLGELAGFEALVRWQHPELGLQMPDAFIPVAEQYDLIEMLTETVLDQALEWLATGLRESIDEESAAFRSGARELATMSINVSAKTAKDAKYLERLMDRCARHALDPGRIVLELTETSAMQDAVGLLDLLTRIRMKGFHLSIDDFGTGYSSMLQLVRMPFSEVKIDRSFVQGAISSEESRAVTRSIVDLGHSLGLMVVAEGVEDTETLEFLTSIGCDLAQGYLIGRPMRGEDVLAWASARWPKSAD